MKQVLIKRGHVFVGDVPAPVISDGGILVKVLYSCISAGTEIMGICESGKPLVKKAMEQPKKIRKAFGMVVDRGAAAFINKIKDMETAKVTGYSAAGIVAGAGAGVEGIKIGDRVACAGAGYANHAEYIDVPKNLVVKMPEGLPFNCASTVALGSIAMQGVRRADVRLGDFAVVIGMGIIGQLTAQMLKASGCRVAGVDIDDRRLDIAKINGCDYTVNSSLSDAAEYIEKISGGFGADVVIITASTDSNELLAQAFKMCRKKGRVVLVGVVGNEFNRKGMYEKELDFLISTSYGPGRYDSLYEEKGIDYPYAYVRWTEQRNMEEYLRLLGEGKINVNSLIEKAYDIEEAAIAYEGLKNGHQKPLIVLLKYDKNPDDVMKMEDIRRMVYVNKSKGKDIGKDIGNGNSKGSRKDSSKYNRKINVAIIGAGSFARTVHLPNLKKLDSLFNIYAVASRTGANARVIAGDYRAKYASTDYHEVLNDSNVDMVMICTRHDLHAKLSIEAMNSGKAVFVEKPMALDENELNKVARTIRKTGMPYLVGFNRRFSKYAVEAKRHIEKRINPMIINYQMNAGYIPLDSWVFTEEGGGRIIGEGCHIIDLFNYFTGSEIESISVDTITPKTANISFRDNIAATFKYHDGSICTLTYTSLGSEKYSKEFCQIYFDGKIIIIDDFRKIEGYGVEVPEIRSKAPQKGQYEELIEFGRNMRDEEDYLIPLWQLEQTARAAFLIERACRGACQTSGGEMLFDEAFTK